MSSHKEMTRYAFISHMEDYIKKLLTDPLHADTDDFLKYHKIDGPKALSILTKRFDPDDKNSAVIIKSTKIKDNGFDENGKRIPDTFTVVYKAPRKDYTKKMRNLYINLFESNIIENSPINEGAWGYGILDNDTALDKQTQFGEFSLKLLTTKINTSTTDDEKWANLGVLVDFLKKYDHEEIRFNDEYNFAIEVCKKTCEELISNKNFISSWENESKIKSEIKHIFQDVVSLTYDKERLNEDGDGGFGDGAPNASSSGQFVAPCFGGPIKKKTMYITQEQEEYIKKMIEEEVVMGTQHGNFGFDAPIGDGKKNKNNKFFSAANDHKDMMKKSWPKQ